MILGISSLLFVHNSVEELIQISSELGAECVEIIYDVPHFPPDYDKRKLSGIRELLESHNMGVSVHGSFWDLNPASHHRELWELSLNQIKRSIDVCHALGGEITVVHFGKCPLPESDSLMEGSKLRYREFLGECLPYAVDRGVIVALENAGRDPRSFPPTVDELKKLVSELDGAKVTFDIGHAHLSARRTGKEATGEAIAEQVRGMRKHIVHVHIHDNHGKLDEHLPIGDGDIDFGPIAKAIHDIKYEGRLIAELWDPQHPLETGKKGMERLRKLFGTI